MSLFFSEPASVVNQVLVAWDVEPRTIRKALAGDHGTQFQDASGLGFSQAPAGAPMLSPLARIWRAASSMTSAATGHPACEAGRSGEHGAGP